MVYGHNWGCDIQGFGYNEYEPPGYEHKEEYMPDMPHAVILSNVLLSDAAAAAHGMRANIQEHPAIEYDLPRLLAVLWQDGWRDAWIGSSHVFCLLDPRELSKRNNVLHIQHLQCQRGDPPHLHELLLALRILRPATADLPQIVTVLLVRHYVELGPNPDLMPEE